MSVNQNKIYDNFLKETNVNRLQKILAKYELFKKIVNVPGDICECGVFKGSGIFLWVKLMMIFKPNNNFKVIGFDFFKTKKKNVNFKYKIDKKVQAWHDSGTIDPKVLSKVCESWGFKKLKLYPGDVRKTTKKYVKENFGSRVALLYLDVDNYEGTFEALKNLYPYVSRGGVIVFDEYALRTYGESDAVDDYFKNQDIELKTFSWGNTPSAYMIKK